MPPLQQWPPPGTLMLVMHSPAGIPLSALVQPVVHSTQFSYSSFGPTGSPLGSGLFQLTTAYLPSRGWQKQDISHSPYSMSMDCTLFPLMKFTLLLLPSEVASTSLYHHLIHPHFHGDTCQSLPRSLYIPFQKLQRRQGLWRPCISSKSRLIDVLRTASTL